MKIRQHAFMILAAIFLLLGGCGNRYDPISDAKSLVFSNASAALGDMVEVIIYNDQWSSSKISDTEYTVTITGTIEADIPSFRTQSNANFCTVLLMEYFNDQVRATIMDGYFGALETFDSVRYLSTAYNIAAGIVDENDFTDANKETSNKNLPLYELQFIRRANRVYSLSRHDDDEVFDSSRGVYYWIYEIVDAPNCRGYTLNSISQTLYNTYFEFLSMDVQDYVLSYFSDGLLLPGDESSLESSSAVSGTENGNNIVCGTFLLDIRGDYEALTIYNSANGYSFYTMSYDIFSEEIYYQSGKIAPANDPTYLDIGGALFSLDSNGSIVSPNENIIVQKYSDNITTADCLDALVSSYNGTNSPVSESALRRLNEQYGIVNTVMPYSSTSGDGLCDDIAGTYVDGSGAGVYMYIGYNDASKSIAYVTILHPFSTVTVPLTNRDGTYIGGLVMGGGTEPAFGVDLEITDQGLAAGIYIGEDGRYDTINFVPTANNASDNPYYVP